MSKKDFKDITNPATMFISTGASEEIKTEPVKQEEVKAPAQEVKKTAPPKEPKGETKSKRLNLLLQPSLMEDLGKVAFMKKDSVNNLINTVLTSYRDENKDIIEKYNKVFEV